MTTQYPPPHLLVKMPPKSGKETILVVDDDPSILGIAHAMLIRYGYRFLGADSPKLALKIVDSPDLAIDLAVIDHHHVRNERCRVGLKN